MKIKDLFEISLQNFRNRRSRIFFTILGVSVAIAAVLFLVAFGYGLQSSLLEKITTTDSLLSLDVMSPDSELIKLNNDTLAKIKNIDNVETVSPYASYNGNIVFNSLTSEVAVNLIDSNYLNFEGVSPQTGQLFSNSDTNKVIVNSAIADIFNLKNSDLIGQKIKISLFIPDASADGDAAQLKVFDVNQDFEIIGIIDDSSSQGSLFVQQKDISQLIVNEYSSAKVKINNKNNLKTVRDNLTNMGFLVSALSDTIDQANKIFGFIQLVLGIFGTVALIVAAIGLINTMTISLLERTNEIGVMRAIGASPSDIRLLFLGESWLIGLLGGVFGIGLGILISQLFELVVNIISKSLGGETLNLFYYPLWFVFFIIILSSTVGLIGGYFPARRAAKLNPIDALKYK